MSKEEKKLKAHVEEYFEKYMCVSFDKFIENWEEQVKENERLNNNKDNAINFIDQVLMYHLNDYKQLEDDCNTLIGILRGEDKE